MRTPSCSNKRMESRLQHPVLGEITLAQTARARRITLSVKPSGVVRLAFPIGVSAKRALAFLDSRLDWVAAARERLAKRIAAAPPARTPEEIEELRRRAKAELPPRVAELAERFGFRYGRVTIRAARTKWGCCTSRNNLSLSLFLMTLPAHLRDFVLLHELCHTVHHDHSARFHALLDRCVGGREKELDRELKTHCIR